MTPETPIDLVTGAFSYSGSHIARRLLDGERRVRTLTFHPDREHPLQGHVETLAYCFDDPAALARSLEGVSTLYNTYWVRFDRGQTSFANAVERSRMLFYAARRAGVGRIVHVSITNPSIASPLPYSGARRRCTSPRPGDRCATAGGAQNTRRAGCAYDREVLLRFHAVDIARAVGNPIARVFADEFGTHGRLRFPVRAKVADELSHLADRVPVAHRPVTGIIDGPDGLLRHGPAGAVGAHG